MEKKNIEINIEDCVECYACQLACSFRYTGAFNIEKARIVVDLPDKLSFTDQCLDGCHICADYCAYGGIVCK